MTPWYTDTEVDDLCAGLTQHTARIKYLRALGLHVERKPNGRPLVMRSHAEAVLAGAPAFVAATAAPEACGPDTGALVSFLAAHKAKPRRA